MSFSEIQLLEKELVALGESLDRERVERKVDIDRLKLELRTLKRFLEKAQSGFPKKYEEIYAQERLSWNPELERRAFRPRSQKVRRKKKSA